MASQPTSDEDLFEAKQAVRSFSWKSYSDDPNNDLTESLAVADATTKADQTNETTLQEQWKSLFDPATRKAFKYVFCCVLASILDWFFD